MDYRPAKDFHKMVSSHNPLGRCSGRSLRSFGEELLLTTPGNVCRLNTKIESRNLQVKDLVADLSSGVSSAYHH